MQHPSGARAYVSVKEIRLALADHSMSSAKFILSKRNQCAGACGAML
jgi:hypothetical protein